MLDDAGRRQLFKSLRGLRRERFHVLGADFDFLIDRAVTALFGVVTRGVHMTVYTYTPQGLKIWIPRHSQTDPTYPGMLDNSVAGGIGAGETPFECVVREAAEEAALPDETMRRKTHAAGTLSWFSVEDERAGFEPGFLHTGVQYIYDLEVGPTVKLIPSEAERKEFDLWDVDTVLSIIRNGEYKPSCALVLIDFLIQHGFITAESERNYAEIVARMHRRLPFSTRESVIADAATYRGDGYKERD